jgi:pyridoxal phosphate enzyme (YggS family)
MSLIAKNLQVVKEKMQRSAQIVARDVATIELLAVSKTFPAQAVIEAVQAGQTCFGENYLQEALAKIIEVDKLLEQQQTACQLAWHFIGPIQSNKTRPIAEHFAWVHSVDRLKIAQRLSEQRPEQLAALNVCVQVNVSGEASKSGVAPEQVLELMLAIQALPNLRLRGLMCVPEANDNLEQQKAAFAQMRNLFEQCQAQISTLDTLSMGMSGDMEAAIAEGSTMIRIGSAIFGKRNYAN